MALNWIHVDEYSINSLLLMERFQLRLMGRYAADNDRLRADLAVALRHNPAVLWYVVRKCPEYAAFFEQTAGGVAEGIASGAVRDAEVSVLAHIEDFVVYTTPGIMDASCNFIYAWDERRLFELADFTGKRVLDIGSRSGRLAFAAAKFASEVYASEPVDTLREYLRDKISREGIANMRVVDGMMDRIPYPDSTFDITMSGHVGGDDWPSELAELVRVTRPGGWILDCPGEDDREREPDETLIRHGWEVFHYRSVLGGDVYRYRVRVDK